MAAKVDRSLLRLLLKSTLMKMTAERNPRSTQVNVEFSRMFFTEDVRSKRENFDVGKEGTGGESHGDEIVAVKWGKGRRVRRGIMGNEERGEVVEGEGGVVGVVEWVGSRWRTVLLLVEVAMAITDSGRPMSRMIRLKLVSSIGGYDEAKARRELGKSKSESRDKKKKKTNKILNTHATVIVHICTVIVVIVHKCTILHTLMLVFFWPKCVIFIYFANFYTS